MSLSATELGVDDRAVEMLGRLPEDKQQDILEHLKIGVEEGKIRNPSAWVAKSCQKPEAHGLDDKAAAMLRQLPHKRQNELLEMLRNTPDVKNPSAWIAKAVHKDTKEDTMRKELEQFVAWANGSPTGQFEREKQLDASAKKLLDSLPDHHRRDIVRKLNNEVTLRNPSAWVAKACFKYGADKQQPGGEVELDEEALELLGTLPEAEQEAILVRLRDEASTKIVRNPSAWVVKASMTAGATALRPSANTPTPTSGNLDDEAKELLEQLSQELQDDITNQLKEMRAKGQIRNPSAWVVKACVKAGAKSERKGKGTRRQGNDDKLMQDVQAAIQKMAAKGLTKGDFF